MKLKPFLVKVIALFILLPGSSLARDWSSYSSKNFTIYSDERPKRAIELLKEFELFRQLAFLSVGMQPKPSHDKMKILLYAKSGEYKDVGPKNTVGFFTNTSAGPRMVVGRSKGGISSTEILYHEYIHYLLRQHSSLIYPRWFDEGLAEVLGATTIKQGKATIGAIPQGRALSIGYDTPFKVRDLLVPDIDKEDSLSYQSRFYAYAWLLTHYLQISTITENQHLKKQMADFIESYNKGEEPIAAFNKIFGMSPEDMDGFLQKYAKQTRMNVWNMEIGDYDGEIEQETLAPGEENFLLADIAWRVGKEKVALEYFEDIDFEDPSFARSLSLAAVLENHIDNEDNINKAKQFAQRALALAPNDSQVLTNYAHWLSDTATRLDKQEMDTSDLLAQQLGYAEQAITLDPANIEAHGFLWQAQIGQGEDVEALKTMMAVYQLEPSSVRINNTIAQHLLSLQRGDLAKPFLERVMNWSHSQEQRQKIKEALQEIEQDSTEDDAE